MVASFCSSQLRCQAHDSHFSAMSQTVNNKALLHVLGVTMPVFVCAVADCKSDSRKNVEKY